MATTKVVTTGEKLAGATPYIGFSAAITLLINFYADIPQDVAVAWTVVIMAATNYVLMVLKPLYKKFEAWIDAR